MVSDWSADVWSSNRGTSTGDVTEAGGVANAIPGTPTATGDLDDTDVDNTADAWQVVSAPTASTLGYGNWTIDATGHWSFTLDNTNTTVQGLNVGATLTDTVTTHTRLDSSHVATMHNLVCIHQP